MKLSLLRILLLLALFVGNVVGDEVRIAAAASLTEVLQEIGTAFEQSTGDKPLFDFAASSTLARQIQAGAPLDLFFSADEEKMDQLEKSGLLVPGTRASILSNSLVIVVENASSLAITAPKDLTAAGISKIAIAQPDTVPAGIYARKYLEKAGLWETLAPRIVPCENVRAALAVVDAGNADAAIIYKTDAAISARVRVAFDIPAADSPRISYPVALLSDAPHAASARRFIDFLGTKEAKAAFKNRGFSVRP